MPEPLSEVVDARLSRVERRIAVLARKLRAVVDEAEAVFGPEPRADLQLIEGGNAEKGGDS